MTKQILLATHASIESVSSSLRTDKESGAKRLVADVSVAQPEDASTALYISFDLPYDTSLFDKLPPGTKVSVVVMVEPDETK